MSKTVKLKQKQDDWQSRDPITIAGITHYKEQGDTANWKGIPARGRGMQGVLRQRSGCDRV